MPALSGSAARRYAEAVLDRANAERAVPAYRASLERLAAAIGPELIRVLRDPRVPIAHRRGAVDAASKDEPSAIRGIVDLLVQRGRIALLPEIARAFGDLVDRRAGIAKAKITTSIALSDAQRSDLIRKLERSSGMTIQATFAVDPSLIGGAKVQVGDRLIDASLRNQLDQLATQLAS